MYLIDSQVGKLYLSISELGIEKLGFNSYVDNFPVTATTDKIFLETQQQLTAYFNGELKSFDLPLNPQGTDFQKSVWEVLKQIPYGQTMTYAQQSLMLQNPKAIRAVAAANGKNPIMIIIPCHRVIGSDGKLTGYAGGLHVKEFLLNLEAGQGRLF